MRARTPLPNTQPQMLWLDDVDSTNAYASAMLDVLPHGTFVVAERQRAGMGRAGRRWHSPPGGVYMTGVVKPPAVHGGAGGGLTLSMALAVCDVLDTFGVVGSLKWPNDVRVGGEKIAGVLAQAVYVGDRLVGVAVGVGINVNMGRDELRQIDQPATSLSVLIGNSLDARGIARTVALRFLDRLSAYDPVVLRAEALRRADYLGRSLVVCTPRGEIAGRAVDLDEAFRLVVEDERGVRHTVQAGDVRCW